MVLIFFVFLWHIFFPFSQAFVFSGTMPEKTKSILPLEKFRQLDQRKQFAYLTSLADKNGLTFSWKYFVNVYMQNSAAAVLQVNEHFIAHQMGEFIYAKNGFDGMTICTPDFAFGCYHGFLDKAFRKDLSGLSQAVNACKKFGPAGSGKFESCAHGIGHGVASYYLVSDLPSALKSCETLTAGQISCADGVFMEFSIDAPLSFYNIKDHLYPCDTVDKKYSHACGRYQPTVLGKMGMSKKDTAAICLASLDKDFQLGCFDALAFSAVYASGGDAEYIINECSQILSNKLFYYECLKAAAGELVYQNVPGWEKASFSLCDVIEGEGKGNCYQYVSSIIQQYH